MQKRTPPASLALPSPTAPITTTALLFRSRSLPDLQVSSVSVTPNKSASHASPLPTPRHNKFYISDDESDTDASDVECDTDWNTNRTSMSSCSSVSSDTIDDDDDKCELLFTKHDPAAATACSPNTVTEKPISLLSVMLQQQQEAPKSNPVLHTGGLRRCQSKFARLDQWFAKAV